MPRPKPAARRAFPRIGVLLAVVALTGCAGTPYVDSRREAGKVINVGPSTADMVAICYGGGEPPPAVIKLAESKCAETGRVPKYERRDRFACNLFDPTRAFFRCVAPPTAPAPAPKAGG
ncbi:MAG: hypothetical protein EPO08_18605 [Rhodospirillaceae bacterium]|nr:MAG: hypothetical protein EPO08_18605 [Rhodospirillaceae bacterium]